MSALLAQLQTLPNPEAARGEMVAAVRAWRQRNLDALYAQFTESGDAAALVQALTGVMDETILSLYRLLLPSAHGVAVIATGGYGRKELFPQSDVDLLVLYRPAARAMAERMTRSLLYILWDLGLKVGHALRSPQDTAAQAEEDLTIKTALLDARLAAGDGELWASLQERLQPESPAAFVEAKLAERDQRHVRFGDSRYLLEPNIKESKGGLRDLHTLGWIARYAYGVETVKDLAALGHLTAEECALFEEARSFLWRVRAHLHLIAGKPEERLTFDRQQAVSSALGYQNDPETGRLAVERLMQEYFNTARSVGALTRIVCALLEEQHRRRPRRALALRLTPPEALSGFMLEGERLKVADEAAFAERPLSMLELFATSQRRGYDISPRALQLVSRNLDRIDDALRNDPEANRIFLQILLSDQGAEQTLRRMNEVGLLGRFIPEFGHIVGRMQFNMYHVYTVDEHTLVAIGVLHAIEQGKMKEEMPLASAVFPRIESRRVLYVSLLAHDIAKGRGEDHSEAGGRIARALALRLGLSEAEAEECGWLVRHHLVFTATAFKRDLSDPQAVRDFVEIVRSIHRLRLLLLLTVADVRAVGPGVWNAWKAVLMRNLYGNAEELMHKGTLETDAEEKRQLQAELAARLGWDEPRVSAYLTLGEPGYLESLDAEDHARVARLHEQLAAGEETLLMEARHDPANSVTQLCVVTPDRQGLFSLLAAAISLSGANIAGARIFTLSDGTAADFFQLQDYEGKTFDQPERLTRMLQQMRQALADKTDPAKELARKRRPYKARAEVFQVPGQAFIENDASGTYTVIEVVGRDRPGLLYEVTRALAEEGLTIGSAHISTYGAQAVDVFYVKDAFGFKVMHEKKLQSLRARLLSVLDRQETA